MPCTFFLSEPQLKTTVTSASGRCSASGADVLPQVSGKNGRPSLLHSMFRWRLQSGMVDFVNAALRPTQGSRFRWPLQVRHGR